MYSESYRKRSEKTVLKDNMTPDHRPTPPDALQSAEEGTELERVMRLATTPDERLLLNLVEEMLDAVWRYEATVYGRGTSVPRAMRGDLRRVFIKRGRNSHDFYAAFHAVKGKLATV